MYNNVIQLAPRNFEQEWFYAVESHQRGNFQDSIQRFRLLANKEIPEAYTEMGNLCELGHGLPAPDLLEARMWYEKAIEAIDCPNAHLGLGRILIQTQQSPSAIDEGIKHITIAARSGNPFALSLLGGVYHFGHGVTKDLDTAAKYYEQAAAQGYLSPLFMLSKLERSRGHWVKGIYLRIKATRRTISIALKDRYDRRLWGVTH